MIKWGILGLGNAANSFASGIKEIENVTIKSTASLSKSNNLFFLKNFQIDKKFQFESYDNLINCKEIDAIYIATPNNKHAELILKCAKAKKGILCEKPMTLNQNDTEKVFNCLNSEKVFFLENIAYRSHPQTKKIIDLILNDEIGRVLNIKSSFGFRANPFLKLKSSHRLFNKKLGGGAINDIGCYPVSFAVLIARLLNKQHEEMSLNIINANIKKNFRGTDDESDLEINFDNLFNANFKISIKKKIKEPTIIYGTKGKLIIDNPWLPQKYQDFILSKKGKDYVINTTSKYSVYANTIKLSSDAIRMNKKNCNYPNMSWEDSQLTSKILSMWKNYLY